MLIRPADNGVELKVKLGQNLKEKIWSYARLNKYVFVGIFPVLKVIFLVSLFKRKT